MNDTINISTNRSKDRILQMKSKKKKREADVGGTFLWEGGHNMVANYVSTEFPVDSPRRQQLLAGGGGRDTRRYVKIIAILLSCCFGVSRSLTTI